MEQGLFSAWDPWLRKTCLPMLWSPAIPQKIIRHRFGPDIVEALLQSEWWTLPEKELEKAAQSFSDPRLFIESRGKRK